MRAVPRRGRPHRREPQPATSALSRRGFLLAGLAAGTTAACGGGEEATPRPQLVSLFSSDHVIAAGRQQRIPFAVVDIGGFDVDDDQELPVTVSLDGEVIETGTVRGRVVDHDHVGTEVDPDHAHADLLRYYALRTLLPDPGVYDIQVDFGGGGVAFLPVQAFDPADVRVVLAGNSLPSVSTPTFDRPEGITPLCTRAPEPCPFHVLDVASVVGDGTPLALLVATPALCATAYCGPVLDTMIGVAPDHDDVRFVHLEVYANADEVDGNYADSNIEIARPVTELGLEFEPALFLVDGGGMVVDRIDNIFDEAELRSALTALSPDR